MQSYDPNNIFAKILRGEMPATKVYEDEVALAFMDIMPRGDGHVLVIPKVPARGILDMPPDALGPYMQRVQTVAAAVKKGMGAEGLTLQQFNETSGGQVVFHIHFHILPRWDGVALKPHSGAMEKPEILAAHAAKIRAAMG
jgi:histidine triad (HIT) family protein